MSEDNGEIVKPPGQPVEQKKGSVQYFFYELPSFPEGPLADDEFFVVKDEIHQRFPTVESLPRAPVKNTQEALFDAIGRVDAALLVAGKEKKIADASLLADARDVLDRTFRPQLTGQGSTYSVDLDERARREEKLDCAAIAQKALEYVVSSKGNPFEETSLARFQGDVRKNRFGYVTAASNKAREMRNLFAHYDSFTLALLTFDLFPEEVNRRRLGRLSLSRMNEHYQGDCRALLFGACNRSVPRSEMTDNRIAAFFQELSRDVAWIDVADVVSRQYSVVRKIMPIVRTRYAVSEIPGQRLQILPSDPKEPVVWNSTFGPMKILEYLEGAPSSKLGHSGVVYRVVFPGSDASADSASTVPGDSSVARDRLTQMRVGQIYGKQVEVLSPEGIAEAQLAAPGLLQRMSVETRGGKNPPDRLRDKELLLITLAQPINEQTRQVLQTEDRYILEPEKVFPNFVRQFGHSPVPRLVFNQSGTRAGKDGNAEFMGNWVRMYETPMGESVAEHFLFLKPYAVEREAVNMLQQLCVLLDDLKNNRLTLDMISDKNWMPLKELCWDGKRLVVRDLSAIQPVGKEVSDADIDGRHADLVAQIFARTCLGEVYFLNVERYFICTVPLERASKWSYFSDDFRTFAHYAIAARPQERIQSVDTWAFLLQQLVKDHGRDTSDVLKEGIALSNTDPKRAQTLLRIAKNRNPDDFDPSYGKLLKTVETQLGRYQEHYVAGKGFFFAGDYPKAKEYFSEAMRATPPFKHYEILRARRALELATFMASDDVTQEWPLVKERAGWLIDSFIEKEVGYRHILAKRDLRGFYREIQSAIRDTEASAGYLEKVKTSLQAVQESSKKLRDAFRREILLDIAFAKADYTLGFRDHQNRLSAIRSFQRCAALISGHPYEEILRKNYGDVDVIAERLEAKYGNVSES